MANMRAEINHAGRETMQTDMGRKAHGAVLRVVAGAGALIASIGGLARAAAAQGCAACYEGAAASGAQGRAALRHGILILLIPTLGLVSLIIGLVYKRRNVSR
jgi:hypothetical protein